MRIVRRALTVAATCVSALTLLPLVPVQAATTTTTAPRASCTYGEINGSGNLSSIPISRRAGQNLVVYTTVHNAKPAALTGVLFDYQMVPPHGRKGSAPVVWWKDTAGKWHRMPMIWYPAVPHGSEAYWAGGDAAFGNLPGGATRRLEMTVDYPSGATPGLYPGWVNFGAKTCGYQLLGEVALTTGYLHG